MKINLANFIFTDKPVTIAENGEFKLAESRRALACEDFAYCSVAGDYLLVEVDEFRAKTLCEHPADAGFSAAGHSDKRDDV